MSESKKVERRKVPADLVEATPAAGGLGHWILASPFLLFLAWNWVDLSRHFYPLNIPGIDIILSISVFILLIVLPFGYLAYLLVTAFPRIFQHTGWEVMPREPVRMAEQYMVRYIYQDRQRAKTTWNRIGMRVGQGWVYLEIGVILFGGVMLIPLFLSVSRFGFGQ